MVKNIIMLNFFMYYLYKFILIKFLDYRDISMQWIYDNRLKILLCKIKNTNKNSNYKENKTKS